MSTPRFILKQPAGGFAAVREFAQAIPLVSDGAFRLYVYACLRAGRHTGCLRATESAIPESYWEPLRSKMARMEQQWQQGIKQDPDAETCESDQTAPHHRNSSPLTIIRPHPTESRPT